MGAARHEGLSSPTSCCRTTKQHLSVAGRFSGQFLYRRIGLCPRDAANGTPERPWIQARAGQGCFGIVAVSQLSPHPLAALIPPRSSLHLNADWDGLPTTESQIGRAAQSSPPPKTWSKAGMLDALAWE